MAGWLVRRQLKKVSAQIAAARRELGVLAEQVEHFDADADADSLRALMSDDPFAEPAARESGRHADSHRRSQQALRERIAELEVRQDDLLDRLNASASRS